MPEIKNLKKTARSSKEIGNTFEHLLMLMAARSRMGFIKLPDGCKTVFDGGKKKLVRVRCPFDFILSTKDKTIFLDAKATAKKSFSYSEIDQSQINFLSIVAGLNAPAGHVICFIDDVYFFHVSFLKTVKPNSSFSGESGIFLGKKHFFDLTKIVS